MLRLATFVIDQAGSEAPILSKYVMFRALVSEVTNADCDSQSFRRTDGERLWHIDPFFLSDMNPMTMEHFL